ncbi:MAG: hypothetical protein V3W50_08860 [Thermoanaerobaculia bacterium]
MRTRILVGTAAGLYEVGGSGGVMLRGAEVRSLSQDGRELWAILNRREVRRSVDGDLWEKMASSETGDVVCLLPTSAGVLVGTADARLLQLGDGDLEAIASFEDVEGRETWWSPGESGPAVRTMATDPLGNLYVNVHVGGIARSSDRGDSWAPTIEVDADVHQVAFDSSSGVLLAASAAGLAVSLDRGDSWRFDTDGLHATYLRAVAVANGTVFVTASTGPFTDHAAVYRKAVTGRGPLERCSEGLPEEFSDNINTFNLAARESFVAFATEDGSVYLSENTGRSWSLLMEGLPNPRCLALVAQE